MSLKAKQAYTASTKENGVVLWDTTLKPLCEQLNAHDAETLTYNSITRKMQGEHEHRLEIKTKYGNEYLLQKLVR